MTDRPPAPRRTGPLHRARGGGRGEVPGASRTRAMFAACACGTLVGGCAGPGPILQVRGAYVEDHGPQGTLVRVVVDARNPRAERDLRRGENASEQAQALREARYRAGTDGAMGPRNVRMVQASITPGTAQRFELPVVLPAMSSGGAVPARIDFDGSVEYVPSGTLRRLLADWLPLPSGRVSARGVEVAPSGVAWGLPWGPGLAEGKGYRAVTSVPVGADGSTPVLPEVR